eukprot:SAG31_NODE_2642_length_5323_cov_3.407351_4_plen_290_part_00
MENHAAEQIRQREHQMMVAQVERTHQALDQCCRPVFNEIYGILYARVATLVGFVDLLEGSHPEIVEEMLSFASGGYESRPDGTVVSRGSGMIKWTPKQNGFCLALPNHDESASSARAYMISSYDGFTMLSQPFCAELPSAILNLVDSEPEGEIAGLYRGYIRHTLIPCFRQVLNTLRDHAAYVEHPPKAWLTKTYPDISWSTHMNRMFIQYLFAYTSSFERIVSNWDAGDFKFCRCGVLQPIGAVFRTFAWSESRLEVKQSELIGMTTRNDVDNAVFSRLSSMGSADES